MTGTLINAGAIVIGSIIGMIFHSRFPKRILEIVFQAIGLFTLFLGFKMAIETNQLLIMIFSLIIGAIIGEFLKLEESTNGITQKLKKRLKSDNPKFTEGLITAFLLFCMGSMTILGAIEEGLGNEPNLLLAKSVLDGFASMALASALGVGVLFSIIPLIIYQGGITLLAHFFGQFVAQQIITELTAVGGILLIGLGINILEIKKIHILNMIPALIVVVVLAWIFVNLIN